MPGCVVSSRSFTEPNGAFVCLLRDIQLLGTGDLHSQRLDAVFFKIKPAAQKALNFIQFMEGLRHCAMITRMSLNDIVHRIVGLGGPIDIVSR